MGRQRRPTLVAEIGRLLVDYPEKDWRALAERLRERALIEDIAAAIDDLLASRPSPSTKKTATARRQDRQSLIMRVAKHDKAKAEKLAALKSLLTDSDNALSLADIRGLANSLGMKDELAKRRSQAVNQIVRHLAAKTTAEIDDVLQAGTRPQQLHGQEFDRWVKLILGEGVSSDRKQAGED